MNATDNHRIIYKILEYDDLCDSSNMTMDDWLHIAKDIEVYCNIGNSTTKLLNFIVLFSLFPRIKFATFLNSNISPYT